MLLDLTVQTMSMAASESSFTVGGVELTQGDILEEDRVCGHSED